MVIGTPGRYTRKGKGVKGQDSLRIGWRSAVLATTPSLDHVNRRGPVRSRVAPCKSTLSFAGDAFAESVVQEGNHYQYRAKPHTRQNAVRRRNLGGVICQHFQNRS